MRSGSPLLRPRDADALRAELRRVAEESGMPLTFGGEVHDDTLLLTEFFGTRTSGMRGLAVLPSAGLGGATVVARRPMSVADYRRASSITHDYDGPVLQEGIKSILAVPVVVEGRSRAVLYGAYRAAAPIGDRTADLMIASARRLSRELSIRDEVDRRLRLRDAHLAGLSAGGAATEEIREVHAQLRRLAADPSAPPALQAQLRVLAERLARGRSGGPAAALSARELDVLAQVALGCTNAEAAKRLSLKPETVKSYLRSATAKLGAHTRHEAVAKARRARLLP
jgi:LuxR family transcriptional regulator, regulator of acetate metabolism